MAPVAGQGAQAKEEAGLSALRAALHTPGPVGLQWLARGYGGEDRCFLSFLRATPTPLDASAAASNIEGTLAFRQDQGLDSYSDSAAVHAALDSHRLRRFLPLSFPGTAPDGCVIQYLRLASVQLRELSAAPEPELRGFVSLWLETALQLEGDSSRARGEPCPGSYDVYDCRGASMWRLFCDVRETRGVLGRVMAMGEAHYPETLYRCFVINASSVVASAWTMCRPFLSVRNQRKVTISTGVPKELVHALGGEAKVAEMVASGATSASESC